FSFLNVSAASPQAGAAGRIQEAVNLLADGALTGGARTVNVLAGTYAENVTVAKSLTLTGAGIGSTVLTAGAGNRLTITRPPAGAATGLTTPPPPPAVTVQGLSINTTGSSMPVSASGLTSLTLAGVEATGGTGSSSISFVTNFTYTTGSGATPDTIVLSAGQLQHTRGATVQRPYNLGGAMQSLTVNT